LQPVIASGDVLTSDMLKHVDDLLMACELAACWFHQWKGDSSSF